MSRRAKDLIGHHIVGIDGPVGRVKDLFFDDDGWGIRYLVVDTGTWLASREVLISPVSIASHDHQDAIIHTQLSRSQVENSPPVLSDAPISRLYEEQLHNHYGWPYYWGGTAFGGPGLYMYPPIGDVGLYPATPGGPGENDVQREARLAMEQRLAAADPHLRSCKEVRGYTIHATDGEIGHVDDFLIDDRTWLLTHVVVDTRNWLPGKRVTLATNVVEHIDWHVGEVCVNLSKAEIKDTPAGAVAQRRPPKEDHVAGSEAL